MMKRFFKKRRRGVMALVAVAAMVPVTGMMSANLNTSQMVNDRRVVQDGADALASMHGAWTARSLNVISMNNVTTAQLMTVAVGSEALIMSAVELGASAAAATLYITGHNVMHCTPRYPLNPFMWIPEGLWLIYCEAHHILVNVPAVDALAASVATLAYYKPGHGVETATKALNAIEEMNQALRMRHPQAMSEIGEDYARTLGLTDLHFADPCHDRDLRNCPRSNTNYGMGLPLEEETGLTEAFMNGIDLGGLADGDLLGPLDNKYLELYALMNIGTTVVNTSFAARGFDQGKGPVTSGGGQQPHVRDHINQFTGIGDALNAFQSFYTNKYSDLPRYPFTVNPPNNPAPHNGQRRQPGTGIHNGTGGGIFDFVAEMTSVASGFSKGVLNLIRVIPFSYDRHPTYARLLIKQQDTNGPNSFTRAFELAHGLVAVPEVRNTFADLLGDIPLPDELAKFGLPGRMAPVPTMWRLPDMSTPEALLSAKPDDMSDAFRILAYGARELSPRLASSVLTSTVTQHTGYGQVGVFNPDGASLYSQNWHHRLMAASRMDDASDAGGKLATQAHSTFDDLAAALRNVGDLSTWSRVHAH